jgi:hypothetical protein
VARPAMALGAWGRITLTGWVYRNGDLERMPADRTKAERWRARARVRDLDGVIRLYWSAMRSMKAVWLR